MDKWWVRVRVRVRVRVGLVQVVFVLSVLTLAS
jgi:hypothetical protein